MRMLSVRVAARLCLLGLGCLAAVTTTMTQLSAFESVGFYPGLNATGVNPDVRLKLTFSQAPVLNNLGEIRVYDVATGALVDALDMSIPPGLKNTRTLAPYDTFVYPNISEVLHRHRGKDESWKREIYQKTYIGGDTEADSYRFYPVILDGNTATICLHHNSLSYGKTYRVEIDASVLSTSDGSFRGVGKSFEWRFSTKAAPPSLEASRWIVSSGGSGDFDTVQGAIDHVPEGNEVRRTIFIENGIYEEIVHFRNKPNITILGESREGVVIRYANNAIFNKHDRSVKLPEGQGYHNRRSVFGAHKSDGLRLHNLTLRSIGEKPAQAEALLIKGDKIVVDNVSIEGSGDALQATGRIYVKNSKIQGFGDNVLGYGAVFFDGCEFVSTYGPHLWVRNTRENHGNVLLNCTLRTLGDVETTIARAPDSNGKSYPYVEAVLIDCKLEGVRPAGWGKVHAVTDEIRYWEYNSTNLVDGTPVDFSQRHTASRQLNLEDDKELIERYRDPSYILEGWVPELELVN